MKNYLLFTDGASSKNPYVAKTFYGGYGYILFDNDKNEVILEEKKGEIETTTTNNSMELTAILEGLEKFSKINNEYPVSLEIVSDSNYAINGLKEYLKNWKENNWLSYIGKPIKNLDLWKKIDSLIYQLKNKGVQIKYTHVYSHTKLKKQTNVDIRLIYNDMVDKLAVQAKKEAFNKIKEKYE